MAKPPDEGEALLQTLVSPDSKPSRKRSGVGSGTVDFAVLCPQPELLDGSQPRIHEVRRLDPLPPVMLDITTSKNGSLALVLP